MQRSYLNVSLTGKCALNRKDPDTYFFSIWHKNFLSVAISQACPDGLASKHPCKRNNSCTFVCHSILLINLCHSHRPQQIKGPQLGSMCNEPRKSQLRPVHDYGNSRFHVTLVALLPQDPGAIKTQLSQTRIALGNTFFHELPESSNFMALVLVRDELGRYRRHHLQIETTRSN